MIQENPLILPSHTQALQAVQQLSRSAVSCIIVADGPPDDQQVVGIFTERDLVRESARLHDLHLLSLGEVMTTPVMTQIREHVTDLFDLLQAFRKNHIRHLPIVTPTGHPTGLVSEESLRKALEPQDLLRLRRVQEVMAWPVIQAQPQDTLQQIASLMAVHGVSCVVIMEDDRPLGIVTEHDLVQDQALELKFESTPARGVMGSVSPIRVEDSLWQANQIMEDCDVRHLVVLNEKDHLVGIITQTNILQTLDPVEIFGVMEALQRTVEERTCALQKEVNDRKMIEVQLQRALFDANGANQAKSEFLAHMSHELRTPLTAILGFTELIATDLNLGEDNRRHLDIINRSGKYLLSLINDLLDMATLEAGHVQVCPAPCNLHSLLRDLEQLFCHRSQLKNLQFMIQKSSDLPFAIVTDEKKLRQILINLIGNAIKFTDRGHVLFKIDLKADVEIPTLQFQIQDTGPGIAAEFQDQVFVPFFQITQLTRLPEGNGLGLAISQQLALQLRGRITLESQDSCGCTFTLSLPLTLNPSQAVHDGTALALLHPQADSKMQKIDPWIYSLRQAMINLNYAECLKLLTEVPPRETIGLTPDQIMGLKIQLDRFDFEGMLQCFDGLKAASYV